MQEAQAVNSIKPVQKTIRSLDFGHVDAVSVTDGQVVIGRFENEQVEPQLTFLNSDDAFNKAVALLVGCRKPQVRLNGGAGCHSFCDAHGCVHSQFAQWIDDAQVRKYLRAAPPKEQAFLFNAHAQWLEGEAFRMELEAIKCREAAQRSRRFSQQQEMLAQAARTSSHQRQEDEGHKRQDRQPGYWLRRSLGYSEAKPNAPRRSG